MTNFNLPSVTVDGGLSRFFQEAWTYPILSVEEEYELADRYHDHDDVDAAHKLVTSHLRLVARIAMKYKGYGLPMADLVSEGSIGLMKAVKKFEPERGFRLSTYAMWWIKAAITEHVLKSWSLVKLGTVASQKKLFFSLRGIKSKLQILDGGELSENQAKQIADATNLSTFDVKNMNARLSSRDYSLNAKVSDEDGSTEYMDTLVDKGPTPEGVLARSQQTTERSKLLTDAMADLPERDREILMERYLTDEPKTLEQLGEVYGVSRERIRQLEARAFNKVKDAILAVAGDNAHGISDLLPQT